jgi:2-beta-glucuronyltransferase
MAAPGSKRAVIISAVHDYRMVRRGSIQAIADTFDRAGYLTTFLSVRFSPLSLLKRDPRSFLHNRSNQMCKEGAIDCYLWRTPFHPFATRRPWVDSLTTPLHGLYANWPNPALDELLSSASVIVVESGLGIVLIERARRLNPNGLIVYYAADDLGTIGAHPAIGVALRRARTAIDHCMVLARGMAHDFSWARDKTFLLGQGLNPADFEDLDADPYDGGVNVVSVGSMLFDPSFFALAAPQFPEIKFHVIGCRAPLAASANVRVYPEMALRDMLPYVAHASVGLAPYRGDGAASYLSESSLKLTQYDYLGLPAVCPHFAVGGHPRRYGYTPGDAHEIGVALNAALTDTSRRGVRHACTWDELLPRILSPRDFPEARIPDEMFMTSDAARS